MELSRMTGRRADVTPIAKPTDRTFENATNEVADTMRRLRDLGEQINREFARLAENREILATNGLGIRPSFPRPLDGAWRQWCDDHKQTLDVPEFLR